MEDKTKDYKQQTIKKFMVNRSKESQSSHDAQKSSDVSNGGTRSINDDKTKRRRINENGYTAVIDHLTDEEDEVKKKEDTHSGAQASDVQISSSRKGDERGEKRSIKIRARGKPLNQKSTKPFSLLGTHLGVINLTDEEEEEEEEDTQFYFEDGDLINNGGGFSGGFNRMDVGEYRKSTVVEVSSSNIWQNRERFVERDEKLRHCFNDTFWTANEMFVSRHTLGWEGTSGSNRSDSFVMILSKKDRVGNGARVKAGQPVRLIRLEDKERLKKWEDSEEKPGKKHGVLEFVEVLSAACSSEPGELFDSSEQAPTIRALECDLLETLPESTWDDYDEIAVVVLEFFQTGGVLKFLQKNWDLVPFIRATKEGNFPQGDHSMVDSRGRGTFFGIGTTSVEYENLVKQCMESLCSLSEATGTEMHLRSMRIANVCKMFGIAPGAKIITGLHHPVTRMFSGFDRISYGAKVYDKKKGIKWDVVPFQYSQRDLETNCEEVRNRTKKEAAKREEFRRVEKEKREKLKAEMAAEREEWRRMEKEKREELRKEKAKELKALKDKKAAELEKLMKTRRERLKKTLESLGLVKVVATSDSIEKGPDELFFKKSYRYLRNAQFEDDEEVWRNVDTCVQTFGKELAAKCFKNQSFVYALCQKKTSTAFLGRIVEVLDKVDKGVITELPICNCFFAALSKHGVDFVNLIVEVRDVYNGALPTGDSLFAALSKHGIDFVGLIMYLRDEIFKGALPICNSFFAALSKENSGAFVGLIVYLRNEIFKGALPTGGSFFAALSKEVGGDVTFSKHLAPIKNEFFAENARQFTTVCSRSTFCSRLSARGADAVIEDLSKIEEEIGKGSVGRITVEQWEYFPEKDGQIDEFIEKLKDDLHKKLNPGEKSEPMQPIFKRRPM